MLWRSKSLLPYSRWLFPSLLLTSVVVFGYSLAYVPTAAATKSVDAAEEAQGHVETLPFCDNDDDEMISGDPSARARAEDRHLAKKLIYVTTLDGHIAALDLENGGETRWDVATEPGELLSSSIQNLELTNKGQVVRIIPSLSGSLYQLTGRSVEAIPITAENLLSLSYKFSDDLVISGGKDTRSYGVSARTGKILYECTMSGCKNESMANGGEGAENVVGDGESGSEGRQSGGGRRNSVNLSEPHDYYMDDVVVVRRQTQTVRAIDPRTGIERWNFSVGNHELDILTREDCHQKKSNFVDLSDIDVRVVVPEGLICAYSKSTASLLWQKKFDFPIVNAWRTDAEGKLGKVDLFSSVQWMYDTESQPNFSSASPNRNPSIYIGLFKTQMYVQESEGMLRKYHEYVTSQSKDLAAGGSDTSLKTLSLPWRPVPAIKTDLMALEIGNREEYTEKELMEKFALMTINNPMATWYASKGFYIVDEDMSPVDCPEGKKAESGNNATTNSSLVDEEIDLVTFVSIWYWWKEIAVISLTSALVLNLFLNNSARLRQERAIQETQSKQENVIVERYIEIPIPVEKTNTMSGSDQSKSSTEMSVASSNATFTSRFLSDFDMIQCLGKGGFGVVFEAKNKLDDCRYAVKRIMLPARKENRDRVMREVKTLANCEHQNIVRFFQAWTEQPPPGWQEDQDKFWLTHQDSIMSTSIDIESSDATSREPLSLYNPMAGQRGGFYGMDLNTDGCSNLDNDIMHTADFVAGRDSWGSERGRNGKSKKKEKKKIDLAVDEEDSFIEFRYSTNNGDRANDDIEMNDNFIPDSDEEESDDDSDSGKSDLDSGTGANYNKESSDSVFKHSSEEKRNRKWRRSVSLDGGCAGGAAVAAAAAANAVRMQTNNGTKMYLYIQMQLCQKQSLKEWLQMTPGSGRRMKIIPIFDQIIQAVEYVHLKGLIHRDLKPSNIFFALDGTVKVGDFGLVTDMEEGTDEAIEAKENSDGVGDGKWLDSVPGGVWAKKHTQQVGTHLYMSPEQLEGGAYDYKVDIYSLGLILFELLVVFSTEMERIKTLTSLRQNNFPVEYSSSYESELELLRLMLSKTPQERPTTFGIRARPPLNQLDAKKEYHFELPSRRKDSRSVSS